MGSPLTSPKSLYFCVAKTKMYKLMGKVTTNSGIPVFGEIVKLIDKQEVSKVAEKLMANRYTMRARDKISMQAVPASLCHQRSPL